MSGPSICGEAGSQSPFSELALQLVAGLAPMGVGPLCALVDTPGLPSGPGDPVRLDQRNQSARIQDWTGPSRPPPPYLRLITHALCVCSQNSASIKEFLEILCPGRKDFEWNTVPPAPVPSIAHFSPSFFYLCLNVNILVTRTYIPV